MASAFYQTVTRLCSCIIAPDFCRICESVRLSCWCTVVMEKKQNQEIGPRLLPLSFCFLMLALSGILFGIYTFRQISWLKTQIHLQQKVIGTLQSGNGAQRVEEVSNYLFDVRTHLSEAYFIFNGDILL